MKAKQLSRSDIIEWDVENWGMLLELWTPVIESLPSGSKVLAIGERNGGLSAWLATKGYNVWCTDRIYPTEKAIESHNKYGLSANIHYAQYDVVKGDEKLHGQFDLVIAKSVIGGLKLVYSDRNTRNFSVQKQAVSNIYNCLKPGGYFLSAENMEGGAPGRAMRAITGKDAGWLHLKWKELPELFSMFEIKQAKAFGVVPGILFKSRMLQKLTYVINRYLLGVLPPGYKYIAFIVARKGKS